MFAGGGCFAALLLCGCASPHFKQGMDAYHHNRCEVAYQLFKQVPGIVKAGSELADGLAKAAACIAEGKLTQAVALKNDADHLHMPMAEKTYFQALENITNAILKYKEAMGYAEIFSPSSGVHLQYKLESLDQLKKTYVQTLHKRRVFYLVSAAVSHAESGDYEAAISDFQKALLKEDGTLSLIEKKKIKEQLVLAKCQHIRNQIAIKAWDRVQYSLAYLDTAEFQGIKPNLIQCIKAEYVSAYCRDVLEKSENYFRLGNLKTALALLESVGDKSNSSVKKRCTQLRFYQKAIESALLKAENLYEKEKQKYSKYLSPEHACDIEAIRIEKIGLIINDEVLRKCLNPKGIEASSLSYILKDVLEKSFVIRNRSKDIVKARYRIACPDGERWHVCLEIWLEKNGVPIFKKINEMTTDRFDIYQGWGPFKKINPGQISVLNSVLENLARENIVFFIPFARCKKQIIAEEAKAFLESTTSTGFVPTDLEILRNIVEKTVI